MKVFSQWWASGWQSSSTVQLQAAVLELPKDVGEFKIP